MSEAVESAPLLPEVVREAESLVLRLKQFGIRARLFGSCAVWLLCEPARPMLKALRGDAKDIDIAVEFAAVPKLVNVLCGDGWMQDEQLRAWTEGTRLRFQQPARGWVLDVCVDRLRFAQTLDLRGRLSIHPTCIAVTDLLLSKLQIMEKTQKDYVDIVAVLSSHPLGSDERYALSSARIQGIVKSSWRWDLVMQHAAKECGQWQVYVPSASFGNFLKLAQSRLGELWRQADEQARTICWYVSALICKVTGTWFDEVETPW